MFFKRHIKQGEEIGNLINSLLQSVITGSALDNNPYGKFTPPVDFFADSYVGGFIHNYAGFAINWGLGGTNWSSNKKGECVISALSTVDPTGILGKSLIGQIERDQSLYQQGANDGTTVIALMYGKLKPDDPDPKVSAAKKLAAELVATGAASSQSEALVSAGAIVTLREYIQNKWG